MKKILTIVNINFLFCSSTKPDTQQNDVTDASNELYNLIDAIEYDENFYSHYTDLNWLTENAFSPQEQNYNKITSDSARDNCGAYKQHGCELKADYKRKIITESINSCFNKSPKHQKIENSNVSLDTKYERAKTRIEELDKNLNMLPSENKFQFVKKISIIDNANINIHVKDLALFNSLVRLIKNIIYYRLNISKFFSLLYLKLDAKYNNSGNLKNEKSEGKPIALFIQFAEFNKYNPQSKIGFGIKKEVEECTLYEDNYIKLLNTTKQPSVLYNSKEYKKITEYNNRYISRLSLNLMKSVFRHLSKFLSTVFGRDLRVPKYYNMLADFLDSLYDISLLVNNNLSRIQNLIDVDTTLFEVQNCTCSMATKQNFIFHWVICWITYFSTRHSTLKVANKHVSMLAIDTYPEEFFVQCIILLHYNRSIDNNNNREKQIDKNDIIVLQATIIELLYSNIDDSDVNFLQHTIYNLYNECKDIYSLDIVLTPTYKNIRRYQTRQEHIFLSNNLVPSIENFVKVLFGLTTQVF